MSNDRRSYEVIRHGYVERKIGTVMFGWIQRSSYGYPWEYGHTIDGVAVSRAEFDERREEARAELRRVSEAVLQKQLKSAGYTCVEDILDEMLERRI